MRRKQDIRLLILLALLLIITIGYAALATTLKINGQAHITKNTWNVYWDVPVVTAGSVTDTIPTRTNDSNEPSNTKLVWSITLDLPGDYYEFTVDAVNEGTIDAMITGITNTVSPSLPSYIQYSVTYDDGSAIANNHLLEKTVGGVPTKDKYKVRIEYDKELATKETVNAIPTGGNTYTFTFGVTYGQATSSAIYRPVVADFENDSWDRIIAAYKAGTTTELQEAMEDGTTKEILLDTDYNSTYETTAHVRIANLSKCTNGETSKTACGLVIEFSEIIDTHQMNPTLNETTTGTGNIGGWEYSDMRAYLNSTTGSTYENTGIFNMLPSTLKSKIISTTVVSGYGSSDNANFTTSDKLYLFSTKEIWGKTGSSGTITDDTAEEVTKQLDYYLTKGVTTDANTYSPAAKTYNSSAAAWWLRSADNSTNTKFFAVRNSGYYKTNDSDFINGGVSNGVSPAFRLSE